MTDSELLRAMGEYILAHGFSPMYQHGTHGCGCFLHAQEQVGGSTREIWNKLAPVVGCYYWSDELKDAGWTKGATEDAAAACFIASDLAAP